MVADAWTRSHARPGGQQKDGMDQGGAFADREAPLDTTAPHFILLCSQTHGLVRLIVHYCESCHIDRSPSVVELQ